MEGNRYHGDFIWEMEGQVSCNGGRREILKPEITLSSVQDRLWIGDSVETKVEAEGTGAGEGLERVSATTFSGPGACWLTEPGIADRRTRVEKL